MAQWKFVPEHMHFDGVQVVGGDRLTAFAQVEGRISVRDTSVAVGQQDITLHLTPEEVTAVDAVLQEAARRTMRNLGSLVQEPVEPK